jgi:hypothetical protein
MAMGPGLVEWSGGAVKFKNIINKKRVKKKKKKLFEN